MLGMSAGLLLTGGVAIIMLSGQFSPAATRNARTVTVVTDPPGVAVYLNEAAVGVSSSDGRIALEMDPESDAERWLRFERNGFVSQRLPLTGDDLNRPFRVALARAPIDVEITSHPSGAGVWIAGEFRGETPFRAAVAEPDLTALPVRLTALGFDPVERTVTPPPPGQPVLWSARLSPQPPMARIESKPGGARVVLEDREIGTTPVEIALNESMRGREVIIRGELAGYSAATVTVQIPEEPGPAVAATLNFTLDATRLLITTHPLSATLRVNQRDVGASPARVELTSTELESPVIVEAFADGAYYGRQIVPAPPVGAQRSVRVELDRFTRRVAFAVGAIPNAGAPLAEMRERLKSCIESLKSDQEFAIFVESDDSLLARFADTYTPATFEQKIRAYDFVDQLRPVQRPRDGLALTTAVAAAAPDIAWLFVNHLPSESQWRMVFGMVDGPILRLVPTDGQHPPGWLTNWLRSHGGAADVRSAYAGAAVDAWTDPSP
jgi:hypothetical protein